MVPVQQAPNRLPSIPKTVIALAIIAAAVLPARASALDILLGTDAAGTFSHFTGRAICRVISQHAEGIECRAVPAPDRIHNLTNIQGGSLDIALIDATSIYDAVNRKGDFQFLDIRYDNLFLLARVYERATLLVVRGDAGIASLDQLKGKRINVGPTRSRTQRSMALILDAKGWSLEDFKKVETLPSSLSQDSMAFCHGSVQAMLHIGVHPDSALQQLMARCNAVPVGMDDADIVKLILGHPAYTLVRIPAASYPAAAQDLSTLGTPVALVASGSLDEETVGAIMTVLDRYRQVLQHAHPAIASFTVQDKMPDIGIDLHPGAAAYLGQ